ncbi:MAG: OMS28 family porin [Microcoleus vaginatus WJT46-NPBG5]|jgi:diguanylate cyclase (GGDEF)-like protein/PAS domain S-box-containing protein|nr:OMS28 family porin [Microcoleus vaginatus WJT46-NPBG5]
MKRERTPPQHLAHIVLSYTFLSSVWLLFSELLLKLLTKDLTTATHLQTVKDWAFIPFSSGLLYLLMRQSWRLMEENKSLLDALVEGSTDAIFVKNLQGHYAMINTAAAGILGKPAEKIIGQDDTKLLSPTIAEKNQEIERNIISAGQTQTSEETITVNGSRQTYLVRKKVYCNRQGNEIGVIGIWQDITERKQLEETLQRTEQTLQTLIQSAPVAINMIDGNGNVQLWNPAAEKMFGWSEEQVKGQFLGRVAEDKPREVQEFVNILRDGGTFTGLETQWSRQDGTDIDISILMSPLRDTTDNFIGAISMITDITARKRLERQQEQLIAQLQRETQELAALSAVTANGISTLNLEELLEVLLRRIVEVMQADTAVFLLKENDHLYVRASIGIEEEVSAGFSVAIGEGFAGTIAATMQPLYIEDAQTEPRVSSQFLKDRGIRTMLGVPLKRNNTLVGVLHVDWLKIHPYNERETHLLEVTGERCAMAISNAQLYEQTKQLQERLRSVIENMPVMMCALDAEKNVIVWNQECERVTGFGAQEMVGNSQAMELLIPDAAYRKQMLSQRNIHWNNCRDWEWQLHCKDGSVKTVAWYNISQQFPVPGWATWAIGIDVTNRVQAEEELRHYAFYDSLTRLPNRTLFLQRLEQLVGKRSDGDPGFFAVLYLDLNRFKFVKYSLGHKVAEQLLIIVSRRLKTCLSPTDMMARLGTDEFAILLENIQDVNDATRMAEKIYHQLSLPFDVDGHEVYTTTSIGVAVSKADYNRPEEVLRNADTAMHQAKMQNQAHYVVFDPAMQATAVERLLLEADLQRAIERRQLRVYYQPIISLSTGKITGFEALVRWFHPKRGMISPATFIPLAEETGLIGLIDRWVLLEACRQLGVWQQELPQSMPLTMSVNLSVIQLGQLGMIERLDSILRHSGVDGCNLKLELTESAIMRNTTAELAMLDQLKALGIQLSIDDFGTGYSSLARLHQLPIDTLKIDRSFVNEIAANGEHCEIVQTIITLAHSLGMDAIAEGVETAQQLAQLQTLQCEYAQGYFFSRPVDSEAAKALLLSGIPLA